jgi:hypothetical protein
MLLNLRLCFKGLISLLNGGSLNSLIFFDSLSLDWHALFFHLKLLY